MKNVHFVHQYRLATMLSSSRKVRLEKYLQPLEDLKTQIKTYEENEQVFVLFTRTILNECDQIYLAKLSTLGTVSYKS